MDTGSRTITQAITKVLHTVLRVVSPEAATRPQVAVRATVVVVLVAAAGAVVTFAWEWMTAEARTRHERAIEETLDDEETEPVWAYIEQVEIDRTEPGIILLDTLSDDDAEFLSAVSLSTEDFAVTHQWLLDTGTPVHHPFADEEPGLSSRWNITLNSTSPTTVTVTDLQLADLECEPASAVAAFDLPEQGWDDRQLVSFSMEQPTTPRLYGYTDTAEHGPNWGEPFFDHRVVNVGGAEEGVGLTVEVVTTHEDCTWSAFEVSWQGPDGGGTAELTNEDGSPFVAPGVSAGADTFFMYPLDNEPDIYSRPLW